MSADTNANAAGTRLTLNLWHPDCWAIQTTAELPGGILAHAVYDSPTTGSTTVNGLYTAYGETEAAVEALLEAVDSSPLTGTINELHTRFAAPRRRISPGAVSREFFLEYDPDDMICPHLLEQGFVHRAPGRIEDGREYWDVCYAGERSEIEPRLDEICEKTGAEIEIERIRTTDGGDAQARRLDVLTESQREAFTLARERGYYEWPRETSTRELAAELDISKTTLLEHLRKAESKLLDP